MKKQRNYFVPILITLLAVAFVFLASYSFIVGFVHSYTVEVVEPTCTEDGYTVYQCRFCGNSFSGHSVAALGHDYSVWLTDLEPSELELGTRRSSCERCGEQKSEYVMPKTKLPKVCLNGNLDGISNTNSVNMTIHFSDSANESTTECYAKVNYQGSETLPYAKRNYSVKLFQDEKYRIGYKTDLIGLGNYGEYCLKANYLDATNAKNLAASQLWNQILRDSDKLDENIRALENCGAVDGEPALLYVNGIYIGIYNLNTPKNDDLVGLNNHTEAKRAMLFFETKTDCTSFKVTTKLSNSDGMSIHYCSTDDDTWVKESFNELIEFVLKNNGASFKKGLGKYIDTNIAIDYFLEMMYLGAKDNLSTNVMFVTYDGVKWIPIAYDLDTSFCYNWQEQEYEPSILLDGTEIDNILWTKLMKYFGSEIKDRYNYLRQEYFTNSNIDRLLSNTMDKVSSSIYASEQTLYPNKPDYNKSRTTLKSELLVAMKERTNLLDTYIDKLS